MHFSCQLILNIQVVVIHSLLLGSLSLQLLAFTLVLLLPVILLAISSAIECLFTSTADLVFPDFTLWSTAKVAFLHKFSIFLAFFGRLCLKL